MLILTDDNLQAENFATQMTEMNRLGTTPTQVIQAKDVFVKQ